MFPTGLPNWRISVVTLWLYLSGCASWYSTTTMVTGPTSELLSQEGITVGEVFTLMEVPGSSLMQPDMHPLWTVDNDGRIHIVAVQQLNGAGQPLLEAHHIVVAGPGDVIVNRIASFQIEDDFGFPKDSNLMVAPSGEIHLAGRRTHLILDGKTWRSAGASPWTVYRERWTSINDLDRFTHVSLLSSGSHVAAVFRVRGKAAGGPGRWEWHGGANYMGAAFWPWYTHPDKLAVAVDTPRGWARVGVIDLHTKAEALNFVAAGDDLGAIHVLYIHDKGYRLTYVRVPPPPAQSGDAASAAQPPTPLEDDGTIRGMELPFCCTMTSPFALAPARDGSEALIAAVTSKDFVVTSFIRDGSMTLAEPLPINDVRFVAIGPTAPGQYYALLTGATSRALLGFAGEYTSMFLLLYRNGAWLAPIEVCRGVGYPPCILIYPYGSHRALLLWMQKKRLLARWIEFSMHQNR